MRRYPPVAALTASTLSCRSNVRSVRKIFVELAMLPDHSFFVEQVLGVTGLWVTRNDIRMAVVVTAATLYKCAELHSTRTVGSSWYARCPFSRTEHGRSFHEQRVTSGQCSRWTFLVRRVRLLEVATSTSAEWMAALCKRTGVVARSARTILLSSLQTLLGTSLMF